MSDDGFKKHARYLLLGPKKQFVIQSRTKRMIPISRICFQLLT